MMSYMKKSPVHYMVRIIWAFLAWHPLHLRTSVVPYIPRPY